MKKNTHVTDEPVFESTQAEAPEQSVAVVSAQSSLPALNADQRGFEEAVDQSDLIIPRAKVLQPLSEDLSEAGTELRAGQIINSLTKEVLPPKFSAIFYFKEYIRFNARSNKDAGFDPEYAPGALMWRTRDSNDSRVKSQCEFGPNGEHPLALTTLNFFCLFEGQSMPAILSFAKTSYKAGKNLLSLAKLRGGAMFIRKYKLTPVLVKNDKGTYYILKVDPAGDCTAEEFSVNESYFNNFAMKRESIKTHIEEATE